MKPSPSGKSTEKVLGPNRSQCNQRSPARAEFKEFHLPGNQRPGHLRGFRTDTRQMSGGELDCHDQIGGSLDQSGHPRQDLAFGALGVDLHEVDALLSSLEIPVESDRRDLLESAIFAFGLEDTVIAAIGVREVESEYTRCVRYRFLLEHDIGESVEPHVALEQSEIRGVGLESVDPPRVSHPLCREERVVSNVGSDIDDDVPGPDASKEPLRLRPLPESVALQRRGDRWVGRIQEEGHGGHSLDAKMGAPTEDPEGRGHAVT